MASLTTFRQGKGVPVVSKFMFDESILNGKSDIKIKQFGGYTIEWAEFILLNRNNNTNIQAHDYDIVIGPIADDTVGLQLRHVKKSIPSFLPCPACRTLSSAPATTLPAF